MRSFDGRVLVIFVNCEKHRCAQHKIGNERKPTAARGATASDRTPRESRDERRRPTPARQDAFRVTRMSHLDVFPCGTMCHAFPVKHLTPTRPFLLRSRTSQSCLSVKIGLSCRAISCKLIAWAASPNKELWGHRTKMQPSGRFRSMIAPFDVSILLSSVLGSGAARTQAHRAPPTWSTPRARRSRPACKFAASSRRARTRPSRGLR
jgi:hypothetical protein